MALLSLPGALAGEPKSRNGDRSGERFLKSYTNEKLDDLTKSRIFTRVYVKRGKGDALTFLLQFHPERYLKRKAPPKGSREGLLKAVGLQIVSGEHTKKGLRVGFSIPLAVETDYPEGLQRTVVHFTLSQRAVPHSHIRIYPTDAHAARYSYVPLSSFLK